jgi:hypothetical protein
MRYSLLAFMAESTASVFGSSTAPAFRPRGSGLRKSDSGDGRYAYSERRTFVVTLLFCDDDTGYLAWVAAEPDGFVLNHEVHPRPSYLVLHR